MFSLLDVDPPTVKSISRCTNRLFRSAHLLVPHRSGCYSEVVAQEIALELPKVPRGAEDLANSLRPILQSQHGIDLISLEGEPSAGVLHGRAKEWVPLEKKELGTLEGVHVALPVEIAVRVESGRALVTVVDPAADDLSEAASFVAGLAARGQILTEPDKPTKGSATYRIEVDPQGRRLLKRSHFSA